MGTDVHAGFQYRRRNKETGKEEWAFCDHNYEGNRHYFLFGWLANVRNGYGFAGCDTGDGIKPLAEPRGLPDDVIFHPEPDHPYEYDDPAWREHWNQGGEDYGDHSKSWLTSTEILNGAQFIEGTRKRGVIPLAQYQAWDKVTPLDSWSGGVGGRNIITLNQSAECLKRPTFGKYQSRLNDEVGHLSRKRHWKNNHVKKLMTEDEANGIYTSTYVWPLFGRPYTLRKPDQVMVTKFVRDRRPTMKASKLKHLLKLQKYAGRVKEVYVAVQWSLPPDAILEEFKYFLDEVKRLHNKYGEVRMVFGFDS